MRERNGGKGASSLESAPAAPPRPGAWRTAREIVLLDSPMDPRDRRVLERVVDGLPLVPEPFEALAKDLGIDAPEICNRINHLKDNGILRQIGGVFIPSRLGYRSAIVALGIPDHLADRTAGIINLHPNITHNALYREKFSIWFALWSPPGHDPEHDVQALIERAEAGKHRILHDLATFIEGHPLSTPEPVELDGPTRTLIEALQQDLDLIPRPFRHLARSVQMSETQLLSEMRSMERDGLMERYGGILRRQPPGVEEIRALVGLRVARANAARDFARDLSQAPHVQRTYVREQHPDLDYNVYAHVTAPDMPAFERLAERVASHKAVEETKLFLSLREYKSCRLKYFTADYQLWRESFLEESPPE